MNWKYIILSLLLTPQLTLSQKIATSLLEFEPSTFKVFPNPSEQIFTIQAISTSTRNIRVFDGSGQLILEQNWTNSIQTNIDLARFPQGIYFYEIRENGGMVRGKLLKK